MSMRKPAQRAERRMPRKQNQKSRPRDKLLSLYQRLTLDGRKHFQVDVARDLGCSPQTVTRLIGVIETHLGKDVEIEEGLEDRRRYYRLRSSTEEKALGFSFEELRYLAICRDLAAPFLPEGAASRINRSLTTLALQLGEGTAVTVAGEQIGFRSKGFIDYTPHFPTIAILRQAIETRQICEVVYRAGGRENDDTYRYAPGRILAMSGTLYMLGYRLSERSLLPDRPTTFLCTVSSKLCRPVNISGSMQPMAMRELSVSIGTSRGGWRCTSAPKLPIMFATAYGATIRPSRRTLTVVLRSPLLPPARKN